MTGTMPLAGLRVRLERTVDTPYVRCGGTVVVIGEGAGPHAARLRPFAAVRVDADAAEPDRARIFIATTNNETPLRDPTVNRRFWSIAPSRGDVDDSADARKIIRRREITVADVGLFCDFPQSWRYLPREPHHA